MAGKKFSDAQIEEAKHARKLLIADPQFTDAFFGRKSPEAQRLAQREWAAWGDVINDHLKDVEG